MLEARATRRLSAILHGDVVSYSRLMNQDEEATVSQLKICREVLRQHIEANDGRVVDQVGDSLLAEFSSAFNALDAAVAAQRDLAERGAVLPLPQRMFFRIGIHLGDVLSDGQTIYGDGVNVAARLQALAEPGGITLSRLVYDLVSHRPAPGFAHVGQRQVKNIPSPVDVYRVQLEEPTVARFGVERLLAAVGSVLRKGQARRRRGLLIVAAATGLAVLGTAVLALQGWHMRTAAARDSTLSWVLDLPLANKPTLAALPFDNLSGDSDLEWIADGFTETLITDLARQKNLVVVARNSAFRFKGRAVDVREVGALLRVRYVLEGSVQVVEHQARINAQLIDTDSGDHLWAQRYDEPLDNLFRMQDKITASIVDALSAHLLQGKPAMQRREPTHSLAAVRMLRSAQAAWYEDGAGQNCERYQQVSQLYRDAVSADPSYSSAWVGLAWHHLRSVYFQCGGSNHAALFRGLDAAQRATSLNPDDAEAHAVEAMAWLFLHNASAFNESAARALALGSNNVEVLANIAWGYVYVGRYAESKSLIRQAIRRHPYYPAWYLNVLAIADFWLGRYGDTAAALAISHSRLPDQVYTLVYTVALHQQRGDQAATRAAVSALRASHPEFSLQRWFELSEPYAPAQAMRLKAILAAAGLS